MLSKVYLKIHDFECPIEDINNALGLLPTKSWVKGDVVNESKALIVRKNSVWQIESNVSEQAPVEEHIKFMLDLITVKSTLLKQFTRKYESELTIVSKCNKNEEFNYGFFIDIESLTLISDVGLSIDMDIYFIPKLE